MSRSILWLFVMICCCHKNFSDAEKFFTSFIEVEEQHGNCKIQDRLLALNERYFDTEGCFEEICRKSNQYFYVVRKTCVQHSVHNSEPNCILVRPETAEVFPSCCSRVSCASKTEARERLSIDEFLTESEMAEGVNFLKCLANNTHFMASSTNEAFSLQNGKRSMKTIFKNIVEENMELTESEINSLLAMVECFADNIKFVDQLDSETNSEYFDDQTTNHLAPDDSKNNFGYLICLIKKPNVYDVTDDEEYVIDFLNDHFANYKKYLSENEMKSLQTIVSCAADDADDVDDVESSVDNDISSTHGSISK